MWALSWAASGEEGGANILEHFALVGLRLIDQRSQVIRRNGEGLAERAGMPDRSTKVRAQFSLKDLEETSQSANPNLSSQRTPSLPHGAFIAETYSHETPSPKTACAFDRFEGEGTSLGVAWPPGCRRP